MAFKGIGNKGTLDAWEIRKLSGRSREKSKSNGKDSTVTHIDSKRLHRLNQVENVQVWMENNN